MTSPLPIVAEQTLKNTARYLRQGMWLLFLLAAALMFVVGRSVPARTGSIWILGCAVLAFMLSFALRDVIRKVGHRNTEDRIVKDVRTFLQSEPANEEKRVIPAMAAPSEPVSPVGDAFVPAKSADFVPLKGVAAFSTPTGDPVVFDAIPSGKTVLFKTSFYAVLQPVAHEC